MIHFIFEACVAALDWMANKMNPWFPGGMDYAKINVILLILGVVALTGSIGLNIAFLTGVLL